MSNILKQITDAAARKEVSFDQVVQAYNAGFKVPEVNREPKSLKLNTIFGFVGILLCLIGAAFYINSFWSDLNSIVQLTLSLGIGLVLFYVTVFFSYKMPKALFVPLMAIVSAIWLLWGIVFAVDKFQSNGNTKLLTVSILQP